MVYLIPRNTGVLNRRNFAYLDRGISAYAGLHIQKWGILKNEDTANLPCPFYGVGIA